MSKPQKIWVRPRRVDEPMVSYLLGTMSLIEQTGVVEGSDVPPVTDEDELEGLQLALRNVVSELKFQTASCSTDKRTATIVELLARAAGGEAATVMLWRCAPYAAFVAHNRYGSHVLQTLVALVGQRIRQEQKDGGKKASGNSGEGSKFNTSSSSLFWEGRSGGGADDDAEHKESVGSGTEKKDDDDDGDWRRDPVDVLAAFWKGLVGLEAVGLAPAGGGDTDAAGGGDDAAAVAAAISAAAIAATPSSVARNLVGMACDVSATHVLRSLLCVCVGVNVVAEKRGKHAKHGHSIAAATSSSASTTTTTTTTTTSSCGGVGGGEETNSHNPALLKLWHKTVAIFAGEDGGGEDGGGEDGGGGDRFATVAELQGMSCDPSGAATLVLLLELEARHMCAATEDDGPLADWSDQTKFGVIGNNNPKWGGGGAAGKKGRGEGKPKSGERVALSPCEQLVDKLLEWDHTYDVEAAAAVTAEGGRQKQGSGPSGCLARTADVVYGLAGEASASHLLETIVRVLPDQKLSALVEHCLLGHFEEYALHGVGNFVVQAVLRVVRNPPVAERVAAELVAALPKVLAANKTGVLWRLAELLGRRRSRSEEGAEGGGEPFFLLPPALRASAAAAILQTAAAAASAERSSGASGWAANGGDDEAGSAGVGAGKGSMAGGVLKLLSPSLPATSATTPATPGERLRLKLDVPGARTVEALLRLKHSSVGGCADAAAPDAVAIAFLKEPLAAVAKSKHFFHHRKPNSASSSASYSYSSSSSSASSASSSSPSVSCALACAVTQLPSSLLASLAVDSLGSRCVLQPVFASDNGNGDNNGDNATKGKEVDDSKDGAHLAAARRVLVVEKLKGSWGSRVAGDGVGQHTLRAAFVGGDLASKEVIVSELADTSSSASSGKGGGKGGGGKGYGSSFGGGGMSGKLAGSAAGRSSMYLAKLDLFVRGRTEWVRAMKRGAATQHLFKDFLSTSSSEKPAAAVGTAKVSTNFSSSSSQPSSEGSKKRGGVTAEATGSGCNGEEEGGGKKAKKAKPTERSTKKRRERETTTSSAQGALPPPAPSESRFLSALGFDAARDGGGGGVGIGGAVLPMKTTAPSSKSTTDATPSTIAPSTSLGFLKSALATAAAAVDNPDPKKKKKKKKKIAP